MKKSLETNIYLYLVYISDNILEVMAHCQAKSTLSCQCNIIQFNEVEFDYFEGGSLTIPHSMVTVVPNSKVNIAYTTE